MRSFRTFAALVSLMSITIGAAEAHAGWTQTFAEEFDGDTLDLNKWQRSDYWGLHTSLFEHDKQCYLDSNVIVGSGQVHLNATNDVPTGCNPDPGGLAYTSGEISTGSSFSQTYGYFEVRMRAPKGAGLLSQFRLGVVGGPFPPTPPEFAPAEIAGLDPLHVNQRYTDVDASGNVVDQAKTSVIAGDYHVYGMDWSPGKVIYYVDGKETYRIENAKLYADAMYLILNLSVGGTRGGAVDTASLPGALDVDYVHVYARVNDGTDDTLPPGVKPAAPLDQIAPVVKLSVPARISFGSTVALSAQASDNVGVAQVIFLADGKQVCAVSAAPFTCRVKFDESVVAKANVTITAQASDAAGNVGRASGTSQIQVPMLLVLVSLAKAVLQALFARG